jgi:hypothetical protein
MPRIKIDDVQQATFTSHIQSLHFTFVSTRAHTGIIEKCVFGCVVQRH